MAEGSGSGGTTFLAFIVGGLVVVVVGFFVLGGNFGSKTVDVNIKAPSLAAPK